MYSLWSIIVVINAIRQDSPVSKMTYTVSSGTLNSTIPYHTRKDIWLNKKVASLLHKKMYPTGIACPGPQTGKAYGVTDLRC